MQEPQEPQGRPTSDHLTLCQECSSDCVMCAIDDGSGTQLFLCMEQGQHTAQLEHDHHVGRQHRGESQ